MADTRELKLKLTVDADATKGSRAMQALADDAKKVETAADRAQAAVAKVGRGQGGVPGSAMPGSSMAGHGTGGGGIGIMGALGTVGGVIATGAAVAAAFGGITEAAARMHDPLTTMNQKLIESARAVPIFGDAIGSLTSSVLGAIERLGDWQGSLRYDRAKQFHPLEMAKIGLGAAAGSRIFDLQSASRDSGFGPEAIQKFPDLGYQSQGLGGLLGFGAFGVTESRDPRLQAAMDAEQRARRASYTAERVRDAAKDDLEKQRALANQSEQAVLNAERRTAATGRTAGVGQSGFGVNPSLGLLAWGITLGVTGSAGSALQHGRTAAGLGGALPYKEALLDQEKSIAIALREQEKLQQAQERLGQKTLDAEQKKYELMKAGTDVMKVRADLLQEEFNRSRQTALKFGAMDSVGQRGAIDAIERFKQGGRNAVTPEELSTIQQLAPRIYEEKTMTSVKGNPLYEALQKLTGQRDQDVIANELVKLKTEIAAKFQVDEEQFAKVMKAQMEGLNSSLEGLIKKIVEIRVKEIETKMKSAAAGG